MNEREALERIAKYPMSRGEEMSIETAREIAREALASQAQQPPKMQFLDRSKEKIITLLWQGICDGTVEAFDVNGMMVIPSEEGMTYVRKEDAISFFGLVEPSQAQQSQWISVEERLPEENCHALVACEGGNVATTFYAIDHSFFDHAHGHKLSRKKHGKYSKHFELARQYGYRITHWMPLPPAPERDTTKVEFERFQFSPKLPVQLALDGDNAAKNQDALIAELEALKAENEFLSEENKTLKLCIENDELSYKIIAKHNEAQAKRIVLLEYDVKHLKDALRAYGDEDIDDDED